MAAFMPRTVQSWIAGRSPVTTKHSVTALSPELAHSFAREVLVTETIRIKALIAAGTVLVLLLTAAYLIAPDVVANIWHSSKFSIVLLYAIFVPFVIFELLVLRVIRHRIEIGGDVPAYRRFLSVLIETSLPSLGLAVHMSQMGPERALAFVVPLVYFIFIILSTLRLDFWLSAFTGLVAAVELLLMATLYPALMFPGYDPSHEFGFHIARSSVLLAGGVLAGAVGTQLRRQFMAAIAAAQARDTVTNLFGQHVSPQVVERLLASGADGATDTRTVAVMFVDIRGFTAAARVRTPVEVVQRLDSAFAVLVEIVDRHHGIVNKFLGDGFLALFGAPLADPDAARRAVTAAHEMLEAMKRDNEGSSWPLRIGIGIHLGEVVAGNVGSPRRKEYTVIGDTVNFASRLEALNKDFGSQLLVSGQVYDDLNEPRGEAVQRGPVTVRGYDQPMPVWQLA
jgi:adenylate cyclase